MFDRPPGARPSAEAYFRPAPAGRTMQTVSVSRTLDAGVEAVRAAIDDLGPFMQAGGFTEATVDGDEIHLRQELGLGQIELHLDIVDDADAALAYEQREGIFREMRTRYEVEAVDEGTRVTATTEFELGGVVGSVLDATVVKRKRRQELTAQFDYLEAELGGD